MLTRTARYSSTHAASNLRSVLYPMTNLSSLKSETPLRIISGSGARVTDDHGKDYFEAIGGLWCTGLGWGNEELVEAASKQMRDLSYYHGFGGRQVPVVEELAAHLLETAPERIRDGKVFFGLSGSDANDTQVRLIWHYNHALGRSEKRKIISRKRAYHGVTVAAGSLTGLPYVHKQMGLPLDFVARHLTCPSFYRDAFANESEADFVQRLAAEFEHCVLEEGPSTVAAFFAEPLQGAGGVVLPPKGYFSAMREVCDKYDILMVGDEVITGFGRTGYMWGCQAMEQAPDLLSAAKQLTSGYVPLSAVMIPPRMYEVLEASTAEIGGVFGHGFTYSGHPVSCAVALKVLEIIRRDRIIENVREVLGPCFQKRLQSFANHTLVGEARGIGLIGALELVADKSSGASFAPSRGIGARVVKAALDHGLIVRALPGDIIALCPPLTVTESEIHDIFDRLERALSDTLIHVSE